jgi:hypothetical protein
MTNTASNEPYTLTGNERTSPAREVTQLGGLINAHGRYTVVFVTDLTSGEHALGGGRTYCEDREVPSGALRAVGELQGRLSLRGTSTTIGELNHRVLGRPVVDRDSMTRVEICAVLYGTVIDCGEHQHIRIDPTEPVIEAVRSVCSKLESEPMTTVTFRVAWKQQWPTGYRVCDEPHWFEDCVIGPALDLVAHGRAISFSVRGWEVVLKKDGDLTTMVMEHFIVDFMRA